MLNPCCYELELRLVFRNGPAAIGRVEVGPIRPVVPSLIRVPCPPVGISSPQFRIHDESMTRDRQLNGMGDALSL